MSNDAAVLLLTAQMWERGAEQARRDAHMARFKGANDFVVRDMEIAAVKSERHAEEAWTEYHQLVLGRGEAQ